MNKYKKHILYTVFIFLFITISLVFFVRYIAPLVNDTLPPGIRSIDSPLYSHMLLNSNYDSNLIKYNVFTGLKKIPHKTNGIGLRSPEIDYSKKIVLISGDSVPFGLGLADDSTFGWLLNNKKSSYAYVNAGIPGKAMSHNLLTLEHFLLESKKKKATLSHFVNYMNWKDFATKRNLEYDVVKKKWKKVGLSYKESIAVKLPLLVFLQTAIFSPDDIMNKFSLFFKDIFEWRVSENPMPFVESSDFEFGEKNMIYLKMIQNLCIKNNIRLINVVTHYSQYDLYNEDTRSDLLRERLLMAGLEVDVVSKQLFKDNNMLNLVARGDDFVHYSEAAMKKIAIKIKDIVEREK